MNITALALKRRVSVFLIILAIVIFGLLSILGAEMELIPDMNMPMQMVLCTYPGADPESIENLVTIPLEEAAASLSGVDQVGSYSMANVCLMMITYDYDVDMNEAYIDLRAALDTASLGLPEDVGEPVVMAMNINALPTVTMAVFANDSVDLQTYVEDEITPALESLSAVASVDASGGANNYIQVALNEELMAQYGLNIAAIAQYIAAMDFTVPAGTVTQGSQATPVSSSGNLTSVANISRIPIITASGAVITLGDVGQVLMATADPTSVSKYNGGDCSLISVTKRQAASTVNASRDILRVVDRLAAENDAISFEIAYDGADMILEALKQVANTLGLGVLLAMLVLFLFFGDFKASLIVGASIPISVLTTLAMMDLFGFSLNVVTAMALVIAIGLVVDSSIVVIESCFRTQEELGDYEVAATRGAKVVTAAITAATLTTVVVYVPSLLMDGMSAQMFNEFCWVVIITLLASLAASLTVAPLCFYWLKPHEKTHLPANRALRSFGNWYRRIMPGMMHRKKLVLFISLLLMIASLALLATMNMELFPTTDEGDISITCTFRSGTLLSTMEQAVADIEAMIAEDATFDSYTLSMSGSGSNSLAAMTSGGNSASFTLYRADGAERTSAQSVDIYTQALSGYTDMDIVVAPYSLMSAMSGAFSTTLITLEGTDIDALRAGAYIVEDAIAAVPGVLHIDNEATAAETAIRVDVDPLLAMNFGLTPAQVAGELYYTLSGYEAAKVTYEGREYAIRLEYPEGRYDDITAVMEKTIATPYGGAVPLSEIAQVVYEEQMQTRTRMDGVYQMIVSASTATEVKFQAAAEVQTIVSGLELPEGVSVVDSVETEMMNEELGMAFRSIFISMFLVFLVMAMQFESVRFSLMVMVSVPFAAIGSFLLLRLSGDTLSLVSMMGFLMLLGIVVNNGILLVDTANQLRDQGASTEEALISSGTIRIRPILMTTLTTILAMVPMLFASGSAEMLRSIALVIIGGLVASTCLILFMLPSFYLLIDKQARREGKERKRAKKQAKKQAKMEKKAAKIEKKRLKTASESR